MYECMYLFENSYKFGGKRPSTTLIRDSLLICFLSLLIANILLLSAEIRPPVPCMYEFHPWLSSNVRPSSLADFSLGV